MIRKKPKYNEEKTTEAASLLIQLAGDRKKHKWILKMLYLFDREAFKRWERPITFDYYFSMEHGQVVSITYDIIKGVTPDYGNYWKKFIKRDTYWCLFLIGDAPKPKKLSPAEQELIKDVFDTYGHMSEDELAEFTHKLPEYKNPGKSSIPTEVEELLSVLEYSDEDIERISKKLEERAYLESALEG